jgi:hypothetical protein
MGAVEDMRTATPEFTTRAPLPAQWDDELISGVAQRHDDGRWEVLFVDFRISGSADTLHRAIDEAGVKLVSYLSSTLDPHAHSLAEFKRRLPHHRWFALVARSLVFDACRLLASEHQFRTEVRRVRFPLRHMTCWEEFDAHLMLEDEPPVDVEAMVEGYREAADEARAFAADAVGIAGEALTPY